MNNTVGQPPFSAHKSRDDTKEAFKAAFKAVHSKQFTVGDLGALLDTDVSTVAAWLDLGRAPTPPAWVERRLLSVYPAMGALYRARMDAAFEPRTPKASRPRLFARVTRAAANLDVAVSDDYADDGELNRDHSAHLAEVGAAAVECLRHEASVATQGMLPGMSR